MSHVRLTTQKIMSADQNHQQASEGMFVLPMPELQACLLYH